MLVRRGSYNPYRMQDQYTHAKNAHSYVRSFQQWRFDAHQCAIGFRRNILLLRSVASMVWIVMVVKMVYW